MATVSPLASFRAGMFSWRTRRTREVRNCVSTPTNGVLSSPASGPESSARHRHLALSGHRPVLAAGAPSLASTGGGRRICQYKPGARLGAASLQARDAPLFLVRGHQAAITRVSLVCPFLQFAMQIAITLCRSSAKLASGARLPFGPVKRVAEEEKGPNGMPELGSPSVRRRRLAAELRRLREERNLTGEDVAESLGWSASKLSRIELARTGIKATDLSDLLGADGVSADHRTEVLGLVQRARTR